jgi:EAL domain-containing protein (putative c-di-GMP-specific phosphodiesterase class I)
MLEERIPHAVPDVAGHPLLGDMAVTTALGVGSYCGVPVRLPDGTLYGTLCGLHREGGRAPTVGQLETLRILARLIGVRLQHEADDAEKRESDVRHFLPLLDDPSPGQALRRTVVQPIVDLATGEAVGFEALSRFTEPSGAPRRTDLVFADARTLGLGGRLELAAARSALALFPDLPPGTYLSVNLSPAALLDPAAFDLLGAALNDAAGRLVVEVTEHQHVSDYPTLLHVLARLRARGLRLAIDDTGSGFASLQHVALMRPEIIKLDIAFVRDVHRDPARRAVTRAMLGFAAEVGATLVAEGVETAAEHEELLRLGATVGQGYHLGRPDDPAAAFARRPAVHDLAPALASGETAVA